MPLRIPKIETIAKESGYECSPEGVIEMLNAHLPDSESDSDLARRIGLSSPSYLFHYCKRKGIQITSPCPRRAGFKEEKK